MRPLNRWMFAIGITLISCSAACSSPVNKDILKERFGSELIPETAIVQGSIVADLDGDSALDWLVAVKAERPLSEFPKGVRVIDIHNGRVLRAGNILRAKGDLALAVTLSSDDGISFLIVDPKEPSLMGELYSGGLGAVMGGEAVKVTEEFSLNAKGDLIIIPTGAGIDTYLYWDGHAFRYFEPDFIP